MHGRAVRVDPRVVVAIARRAIRRLRAIRIERDVSVHELAAAADLNAAHLFYLEQCAENATLLTVIRIACALGVPVYEILE